MNNLTSSRNDLNRSSFTRRLCLIVSVCVLLGVANAQTQRHTQTEPARAQKASSGASFTPQAGGPSVHGSGTAGMIPKWLDSSSIGDSIMSEASGKIGIGITIPASKLSVAGMIETTLGGYKFPDGTIQTTAATAGIGSVAHNSTLTGNGTASSPLGVAIPLTLSGSTFFPQALVTLNQTGFGYGLLGSTDDGTGVAGISTNSTGVYGQSNNGFGVWGVSQSHEGVIGSSNSGTGVFGGSDNGKGVFGVSQTLEGVVGSGGSSGVCGFSGSGDGVFGFSETGWGVRGLGHGSLAGVVGASIVGPGVSGESNSGDGVLGFSSTGAAGRFLGNVVVTGTLSKAGGSFKIDHPLDPENKYLYHSFVESPDMMNIYNGNVTTDESGEAVVKLPAYFEALNFEFRYQLTVIGQFAQAIVSRKINNNEFAIRTSVPSVEVSWQVTGVRRDAWANKNRIPVEADKKEGERGLYLHPEAFDQPADRGIQSHQLLQHADSKKAPQ